jgi:hypothetical protein
LNRGQLNSFLGLPTDGGMHAAAGAAGGGGMVAGPDAAAAGRWGATGHAYQGPMGTTVAHGTAGAQGAAITPGGAAAGGKVASGTAIEGPGGNVYTHTASAGRGVAAGPGGVARGSYASSDSAVRTSTGDAYAQGASASRGFAAGSGGVAADGGVSAGRGYAASYGTQRWSPTYCHAQGMAAQGWCYGAGMFTPAWSAAHPWAWQPAGYAAATWANAAWDVPAAAAVGAWIGSSAAYVPYDYGDNVTYQNNYVYYGSQPAATQQQYYQEAAAIAGSQPGAAGPGATAAGSGHDAQWLPMGVFGLVAAGQKTPAMIFQLAVDKAGTIRGNYFDQVSDTTVPVAGAIDKKEQRAAWRVGNNKKLVIETGLYNLTQDQSTALVHDGPDQTQQYVLVRMKQPVQDQQQQ